MMVALLLLVVELLVKKDEEGVVIAQWSLSSAPCTHCQTRTEKQCF